MNTFWSIPRDIVTTRWLNPKSIVLLR